MKMTEIKRQKLPGKPRPSREVYQERIERRNRWIEDYIECGVYSGSRAVAELVWSIHYGDVDEDTCRWRIQLSCGNIREVLSAGKDMLPFRDLKGVPDGQAKCHIHDTLEDVVAYEYVGLLIPKARTPREPDPKAILRRQLREAERQAARIRKDLDNLGTA